MAVGEDNNSVAQVQEPLFQHNPFATRYTRPSVMPFLSPEDSETDLVKVALENFRKFKMVGQVVGPHGCGKTTLCRALAKRLGNEFGFTQFLAMRSPSDIQSEVQIVGGPHTPVTPRPRLRLPHSLSRRSSVGSGNSGLLVIDGLERVSFVQQQLLIHNVCRSEKYGGLLVTSHVPIKFLITICEIKPSLDTLQNVVAHLAPELFVPSSEMEKAFAASNHNIRESLMLLFDWFQTRS